MTSNLHSSSRRSNVSKLHCRYLTEIRLSIYVSVTKATVGVEKFRVMRLIKVNVMGWGHLGIESY